MKNVRPRINQLYFFAVVSVLAAVPVAAHAKGFAPVVTQSQTGVNVATVANAQAVAVLARVGANVNATSSIITTIASGVTVNAVVTGAISGASVAGAWGAAIGGVGALALVAMPAVKNWMDSAGVKVTAAGGLTKPDPSVCSVAPCYEYWDNYSAWHSSVGGAAAAWAAGATRASDFYRYTAGACSGVRCEYESVSKSNGRFEDRGFVEFRNYRSTDPAAPGAATGVPATVAEAQAVLTASAPTVEVVQALVDLNFPPVVTPLSITGPASIAPPGLNTVKLGLDGSQETETCKFYLEYFPSNIKAHPECTVTTVTPPKTETLQVTKSNPDGTTSTQSVTTTTPGTSTVVTTKKDAVAEADKPAKTDCEKFPDNIGCQKVGDVPNAEKLSNIDKAVSITSVAFAGGSCPQPIGFTAVGRSYAFSYGPMCDRLAQLKWVFMAMASVAAAFIFVDALKV